MAEQKTTEPVSLVRQLGVTSAAALVVANMVGSGIFITTPFLAGDLASVPLVLSIWLVGAFIALAGAFCYSELGVNFPSSGGEYVYLTQAYGPVWGFMTGWISFVVGFSCAIAAAALAFANYLSYFWPAWKNAAPFLTFGPESFRVTVGPMQLAACALIGAMTLVNLNDLKTVAKFQNFFTGFKIAVLFSLIVLGFLFGNGNWNHFSMDAVRTSTVPIGAQFAISLCFLFTSYSGWNAATYIAEEVKQPARTLPKALALGTLLVATLYFGLNLIFLYAMPLEEMKSTVAIGSGSAVKLFGPGVASVFTAAMAIALFSSVNSMIVIGPRVYYAMARNRAFFKFAAQLSTRTRTPVNSILVQGAVAMLVTMTPLADLVLFIGFTLNIFTVITVASLFIFRKRAGWQKLPAVSFLYPLFPVLYIAMGLWVTYFGLTSAPKPSLIALGLIFAGAAVYKLRIKDQMLQHERSQAAAGD